MEEENSDVQEKGAGIKKFMIPWRALKWYITSALFRSLLRLSFQGKRKHGFGVYQLSARHQWSFLLILMARL
jgi:hypothetical protein